MTTTRQQRMEKKQQKKAKKQKTTEKKRREKIQSKALAWDRSSKSSQGQEEPCDTTQHYFLKGHFADFNDSQVKAFIEEGWELERSAKTVLSKMKEIERLRIRIRAYVETNCQLDSLEHMADERDLQDLEKEIQNHFNGCGLPYY
tara:strand:- start:369 stop:803 length:435 start_codon:yes stop_codon:yes gene_type:complete